MRSWKQTRHWIRRQTTQASQNKGGRTLLEIVGKDRLVVEHHRGIQSYSTEEILIRASFGLLEIRGTGLRLCCMSREQLCVMGKIDRVELMGRGDIGAVE